MPFIFQGLLPCAGETGATRQGRFLASSPRRVRLLRGTLAPYSSLSHQRLSLGQPPNSPPTARCLWATDVAMKASRTGVEAAVRLGLDGTLPLQFFVTVGKSWW